uniref:NuA4 complex subunit EAF3 n=1 Tax=Schizaphis graminum TaxID=13262 RepID=A0A2S2P2D1_SCHGA
MSESTSNIICANRSTNKENSELNVFNEMSHIIDQTKNTDENMEISDDESIVTIGELSVDEYYDDIIHGKQRVHTELDCANQNEKSESSNNVNNVEKSESSNNVNNVNNEDSDEDSDEESDYDENLEGQALIVNDIHSSLPTVAQVNRHIRENAHDHTNEQVHGQARENTHVQPAHNQNYVHTLKNTVCYRQACNNLVMPIKPKLHKQRAAAIEAAAKIAKSAIKKKNDFHRKINSTKIYYSCGHREKISDSPLKFIGIKTPRIMKESRLLDERLMKTTFFLLKLPASLTVQQIFNNFQRKVKARQDVMNLMFASFNYALSSWCLYFIEKRQYDKIIKKYPNREKSELYGLAHLYRFIATLPRLYNQMRPQRPEFCIHVTCFINRLLNYLVEENLQVDIENDYEHASSEYHRLTYKSIHNQR